MPRDVSLSDGCTSPRCRFSITAKNTLQVPCNLTVTSIPGCLRGSFLYTQRNSFRNFIKSTWNQIVVTIFRLIWKLISLCVSTMGLFKAPPSYPSVRYYRDVGVGFSGTQAWLWCRETVVAWMVFRRNYNASIFIRIQRRGFLSVFTVKSNLTWKFVLINIK